MTLLADSPATDGKLSIHHTVLRAAPTARARTTTPPRRGVLRAQRCGAGPRRDAGPPGRGRATSRSRPRRAHAFAAAAGSRRRAARVRHAGDRALRPVPPASPEWSPASNRRERSSTTSPRTTPTPTTAPSGARQGARPARLSDRRRGTTGPCRTSGWSSTPRPTSPRSRSAGARTTTSTSTSSPMLADEMTEVARRDARAIVLCSEGKHFCAGADFSGAAGRRRPRGRAAPLRRGHPAVRAAAADRRRGAGRGDRRRARPGPRRRLPRRHPRVAVRRELLAARLPPGLRADRHPPARRRAPDRARAALHRAPDRRATAHGIGLCDHLVAGRRAPRPCRRARRRDRRGGPARGPLDPADACAARSSTRSAPPWPASAPSRSASSRPTTSARGSRPSASAAPPRFTGR